MELKGVVFDLVNTLGHFKETIKEAEASSLLINRGYEIYPQTYKHAFSFTVFIDYPRHGFRDHETFLRKMFKRLKVDVDDETLRELATLYKKRGRFQLYPESKETLNIAKTLDLKTTIATTTPQFLFEEGIREITSLIDFICTGYEAGCEKSNPKMYRKIFHTLGVKPHETAVIGDDITLDIVNSKRLGARTIHINRDTNQHQELAEFTAHDVQEAMNTINTWINPQTQSTS